ncbi:hypothetical protein [Streptacidiphilus sp. P02-A3a]|uniref:hypothetical protein n=1 Tax=Streptacidiphilus sp. P02-A3a TaxID=2704468 RepID=UPI0015F7C816|nr:hypothetical protein [Streptacidiphilus sp. P02-A3a]QMU73402.1 hypothetical protein GXP74_39465 [Streptacidiphilus sp. P02-A3a]
MRTFAHVLIRRSATAAIAVLAVTAALTLSGPHQHTVPTGSATAVADSAASTGDSAGPGDPAWG